MQRIVILTGAGVSAESGLGTFRDKGGLWDRYDLSEVATPEGFAKNPALVHDFYNARRDNALQAVPNAAHVALARLQAAHGGVTLITQNIDDLHERGGSRDVIHMHGQIMRALCAACGGRWDAPRVMEPVDACPACDTAATRPDIVWFGEFPYHMERIAERWTTPTFRFGRSAIGTSGEGPPGGGLSRRRRGRAENAGDQPRTLPCAGPVSKQGHQRAPGRGRAALGAGGSSSAESVKGARPARWTGGRGVPCAGPVEGRTPGPGCRCQSPWLWPWL